MCIELHLKWLYYEFEWCVMCTSNVNVYIWISWFTTGFHFDDEIFWLMHKHESLVGFKYRSIIDIESIVFSFERRNKEIWLCKKKIQIFLNKVCYKSKCFFPLKSNQINSSHIKKNNTSHLLKCNMNEKHTIDTCIIPCTSNEQF